MIQLMIVVMSDIIYTYKVEDNRLEKITYYGLEGLKWKPKSLESDLKKYCNYLKEEFSIQEFYGFDISIVTNHGNIVYRAIQEAFIKSDCKLLDIKLEAQKAIIQLSRKDDYLYEEGVNFDGLNFRWDRKTKKTSVHNYNLLAYYLTADEMVECILSR